MNISKVSQNYAYTPNFKGRYEVDASTAVSRNQVFTLGMLMSNFWIRDARFTCTQLRNNSVYGKAILNVNVDKERIVERILQLNNIKYRKLDTNV
ncbi:MAG: hypothetical protein KH301_04145 [Brachyspira sp.]|uniref:hypothetical protein n=1 Tax=Candidatus Scatousia sp. TaxID=3085663 RepID=UPI004027574B|nr:hypothetical protein [Brachyspira sp.]